MKRPNAAKREPVDGPTELELLEFAKEMPLDVQARVDAVYTAPTFCGLTRSKHTRVYTLRIPVCVSISSVFI